MTTVTILRELWRRRLIVAVGAVLSVVAGLAVAYEIALPASFESRKYTVSVATARILVDTPSSQIVEVAPKGSESLGERASLLANLMIDGELKTAIAARAGMRPDELLVVAADAIEPATATPAELSDPTATILTTKVLTNDAGVQLPIIDLVAQAPNTAAAATLANAAVTGLRDFLDSRAAIARVPDARRLRVNGLGSARAREVSRGPSQIVAMGVAILLFTALCFAILSLGAIARGWRAAAAQDQERDEGTREGEQAFADHSEDPPAQTEPPLLLRAADR